MNQLGGLRKCRITVGLGTEPGIIGAVRVVVQKYGGSSVADLDRLQRVADRVAATLAAGLRPVVVVSAMGDSTNQILALAHQVSDRPDRRELDMLVSVGERVTMSLLAMALRARGVPARSLTGSQSGIVTDEQHADARIVEVRPQRLLAALEAGEVPIVAGFQGVSREREVTTLGRGGSDTTAVVLAAALGAEHCEICSDVDGVWTADPRIVPGARRIAALSPQHMWELSRAGATVLFEDAVRFAMERGVVLQASATFRTGEGTRVGPVPPSDSPVGCAVDRLTRVPEGEIGALSRGVRLRRRSAGWLWLDTRNSHGGDMPGAVSCTVVSLVGGAVGEQGVTITTVDAALSDAGIGVTHCGSAGEVAWWEVSEAQAGEALGLLHRQVR